MNILCVKKMCAAAVIVLAIFPVLRAAEGDGREHRPEAERWERIKKDVEGAVKRGELTRGEADEKYRHIKREMTGQKQRDSDHRDPRKARYMQVEREVKAKVEAGEISPEDARRHLGEVRRSLESSGDRDREASRDQLYEKVHQGLRATVALGKMSEREADERWQALSREREEENRRRHEHELRAKMEQGMRAAVALGNMSEEEARKVLEKGARGRRGE